MWFRVNSEQNYALSTFCEKEAIAYRIQKVANGFLFYIDKQCEKVTATFSELSPVESVGYVLASREVTGNATCVAVNGIQFIDQQFHCIAGPCAVESLSQLEAVADNLITTGTRFLRAGAFKPRTSPYNFQGMGKEGIALLADIKQRFNLQIVTELMDISDLDDIYPVADIIQIGSRNMHNTSLLKAVGELDKPILLKRGLAATYEEFLLAAEYILAGGNRRVILCERGVRAFQDKTRNILDLAGVALLKQLTHLPVIVDPSHATGLSELVPAMSIAAMVTGANGIMVEVHPEPEKTISDARQAIDLATYQGIVEKLKQYAVIEQKGVNGC